jgi:CHAD domain-containing protein
MAPLQKRTRSLVTDFRRAISKLGEDVSPNRVHRLRTTIRRFESLVSHTHPELTPKQEKTLDEVAELRKRAGKVRDLDIQTGLLGAIANGSTASDRRAILETVKWKRNRQVKKLVSTVKEVETAKFFARIRKIAEKASINIANDGTSPLATAQAELAELATKFDGRQSLKPRRLHQLRIELKRVRYTAELAEDSPQRDHFLAEMKAIQDAIGEWHDWEILVATAEKQFSDRVNCALLVEMRSLVTTKFSVAASAVTRLLAAHSHTAPRKPSRSVTSAHALAQRA